MDSDRYRQITDLFAEASELPSERREAFLSEACGEDHALRQAVDRLLEEDRADSGAWDSAEGVLRQLAASDPGEGALPRSVGPYRILRRIASGGMAEVFEAEQREPRRRVALKVIRGGGRELLQRFRREAELLGRLEHVGIARIYEAETTAIAGTEQPYLAMELVDGPPLHVHVRERGLGVRDSVALIVEVCHAVGHAHRLGIVHRDLKPDNVLVGPDGRPKVLDFGIARVAGEDSGGSLRTRTGQLLGTPAYMAPEQYDARWGPVDPRTDVFALGVMLHQLLTGSLPLDLADRSLTECARIVQNQGPARLGRLDPALRGDLETLVLKAMEKDPADRFSTVHDLAEDLGRFLRDEAIHTRPAPPLEQLRRFARRNRRLVASIAAVFIALVLGLFGVIWGLLEASGERDRALEAKRAEEQQRRLAEREERLARAVNDFLVEDLLDAAHPDEARGRDQTMLEVLERAEERVRDRFADEPLARAAILLTLGKSFSALGEYARAHPHLLESRELHVRELGSRHPRSLGAAAACSSVLLRSGQVDEAVPEARRVLALHREVLGEGHADTLRVASSLALALDQAGRFEESEPLHRAVLAAQEQGLGRDHVDTLVSLNNFAGWLYDRQRYDEAEPIYREVLTERLRQLGADHPRTLNASNNLGTVFAQTHRFAEAAGIFQEVYDARCRVLGPTHDRSLGALANLAMCYQQTWDHSRAEALYRRALPALREELGNTWHTLLVLGNLAQVLMEQGQVEEAEELLLERLEVSEEELGADHPDSLLALERLVQLYLRTQRPDEAEAELEELEARLERAPPQLAARRHGAALKRAELSQLRGQEELALARWDELLRQREQQRGADHPDTVWTRLRRASCLAQFDRLPEAEALLRTNDGILARQPDALGSRDGPGNEILLADVLLRLGRTGEALPRIERGLQRFQEGPALVRAEFRCLRGRALLELGRIEEALEDLREGVGVLQERAAGSDRARRAEESLRQGESKP